MGIVYVLIIGAIVGWLAGSVMRGGGFGLLINIILGIIGGFVGRWLFGVLDIGLNLGSAILNQLVVGFIGAVVILLIAGLFRR